MDAIYDSSLPVYLIGEAASLASINQRRFSRRQCLAVNAGFRAVPFADAMLFDAACLDTNRDPGGKHFWRFKGQHIITVDPVLAHLGFPRFDYVPLKELPLRSGRFVQHLDGMSTGAQAIGLAVRLGARKIILVGYQLPHGDNYDRIAQLGLDIVNATEGTKLDAFPVVPLDDAL